LLLVVSPAIIMGTVGETPFGRLNPGTFHPGDPVPSMLRRRGTTSGSSSSFGIDLTNTSKACERGFQDLQVKKPAA